MKTRRRNPSAGHSWASNLFWFLVALLMLFISYRLINPIYHEYFLSHKAEEICRLAVAHQAMKVEDITNEILEAAEKEKIPLKEEGIEVKKSGMTVFITLSYDETVDLVFAKWTRHVKIDKNSSEMSF